MEPVSVGKTGPVTQTVGGRVESGGKASPIQLSSFLLCLPTGECSGLTSDAFAEQELGCGVEGQPEEDRREVDFVGPAGRVGRQVQHEILNVKLLDIEISDLIAGELGT